MKYIDKLRDPRWQKKRLQVFDRDDWKCKICGSSIISLVVHHMKYIGPEPWDTPLEWLLTYCEECNQWAHNMNGCIHNTIFGTLGCFPMCVGFNGIQDGGISCDTAAVQDYLNWIQEALA